ncbi:uL30 family ribosomal protein [Candidatus Woesearchaeota archaeon]|nr:uL30 family ribosomal protein [Candidatus Woesearchaeota archaeon]
MAAPKEKASDSAKEKGSSQEKKLVAILLRGRVDAKEEMQTTFKLLRMLKKHTCVLLQDTSPMRGMLRKVKDYITWGEIDAATAKLLLEKRNRKESPEACVFHLHPPRGGFERRGIKRSFTEGGALGYRGAKINELLQRMI